MSDEYIPLSSHVPIQPGPEEPIHELGPVETALGTSGLVFALNEFVLHGRGFDVMILNGKLVLRGDGGNLRGWNHIEPVELDKAWRRFRQTLLDAQGANKRRRDVNAHSSGFLTAGNQTPPLPQAR